MEYVFSMKKKSDFIYLQIQAIHNFWNQNFKYGISQNKFGSKGENTEIENKNKISFNYCLF